MLTIKSPVVILGLALLFLSSIRLQAQQLDDLMKGKWWSNKYLYSLLKGDTLILSRSNEREWRFKRNGALKGYGWRIYCGRTPKRQRREHPWEKLGTWRQTQLSDGDYLNIDLYIRTMILRHIATDDRGMVFVTMEAPDKVSNQ